VSGGAGRGAGVSDGGGEPAEGAGGALAEDAGLEVSGGPGGQLPGAPPAERVRLFAALELPPKVRQELVRWRERAPGTGVPPRLRWVTPASLHVTLCFLGWRPVEQISSIAEACAVAAACGPAQLTLADPVWLPPRRPRVLAVELRDEGDGLARVQERLSKALEAGGWYEPEKRPFRAHVTVARVPKGGHVGRVALPAPAPMRFTGRQVTLFRSRLSTGGARYEPLASVALGT
jgi:RNA 2',3'-cyclic 3'-phosphodiesterase